MFRGFKRVLCDVIAAIMFVLLVAEGCIAAGRIFFRSAPANNCNGGSCAVPWSQPACTPTNCVVVESPQFATSGVPVNAGASSPIGGVDRSTGVGSYDGFAVAGTPSPPSSRKEQAASLPDDHANPYIVVVGDKPTQEAARSILEAKGVTSLANAVYFGPEDWQVKDVGYTEGIWVTAPRGKDGKADVLAFASSPQELSQSADDLAGALRKPDGILDKMKIPRLRDVVSPAAIVGGVMTKVLAGLTTFAVFAGLGLAILWK